MIVYQEAEKAGCDSISVTVGWQESIVPVISRDIDFGSSTRPSAPSST